MSIFLLCICQYFFSAYVNMSSMSFAIILICICQYFFSAYVNMSSMSFAIILICICQYFFSAYINISYLHMSAWLLVWHKHSCSLHASSVLMLCRQADCSWFKSPTGELALKGIQYLDIERSRQLNFTENFNSLREGIEYYCKYIELTCMFFLTTAYSFQ